MTKFSLLSFAATITFTVATTCLAGNAPQPPAKVQTALSIKNTSDIAAEDFHIELTSDAPINLLPGATFGNTQETKKIPGPNVTVTPDGNQKLTIDIDPLPWKRFKGSPLELKLEFNQTKNEISGKFHFTAKDALGKSFPLGDDLEHKWNVQNDPELTMFNDTSSAMGIRGLQFLYDVPEIPLENLLPGGNLGFGPILPDFIIPPNSSLLFHIPNLSPGNFVYWQDSVFDETFTTESYSQASGHQQPIPEISSELGLAALILGFGMLRIRKKRQSECHC